MDFSFFSAPQWYFALTVALFGLLFRAYTVYKMAMKERAGQPPRNNPAAFMSMVPTAMATVYAFFIGSENNQGRLNFASGLCMVIICMGIYALAVIIMKSKLDTD